jgi:sugar lactone lactonase YvrE
MEDKGMIKLIEHREHVQFDNKITWSDNEFTLNFIDWKNKELVTYRYKNKILTNKSREELDE